MNSNYDKFKINFIGEIKLIFNDLDINNDTIILHLLNYREMFYLYNFILKKYFVKVDFKNYQTLDQIALLIYNEQ